ncbi:glycerophosphodiester phosphodiesterase family protein [Reyranella sp.]|jgi:glycerophosphoryl diester phosphodiesterase|uniref:glycerophosphodiester phosphodiesterase family protein n=1 Tax=Reyranella sp. TaxID=1929291 RepID=UPI002F93F63C
MTEIASHRGGALLWPENSATAFENTARLPVDQVEFDVHPSSDGMLVIIHDATLDRTTNGSGPVSHRSFAELSKLSLKGTVSDRILLLDEVIDIFVATSIKLRVELKQGADHHPYPGMPQRVIETLRRRNMLARSIVTSFQMDTVCQAGRCADLARHVFLVTPSLEDEVGLDAIIADATARGVPMLGLRWNTLDSTKVGKVRAAALGIGGWAANDEAAMEAMFNLEVDVFTSDRPDLALRMRQDRLGKGRNGRALSNRPN